MLVNLENDWFSPRGRIKARDNPVTLPDEWVKLLPTSANIVEGPAPTPVVATPTAPPQERKEKKRAARKPPAPRKKVAPKKK